MYATNCIILGCVKNWDGDIRTRVWGLVTQGRETRDLGTSRVGHRDVLDRDMRRQIQGCEDVKYRDTGDVTDYCKSQKEMRYQSLPSRMFW